MNVGNGWIDDCPICKSIDSLNYWENDETGEMTILCMKCGSYKESIGNKMIEKKVMNGVIHFTLKNDVVQFRNIERTLTEEDMENIKQDFEELDINKEKSYVTIFDKETGRLDCIIGNMDFSKDEEKNTDNKKEWMFRVVDDEIPF